MKNDIIQEPKVDLEKVYQDCGNQLKEDYEAKISELHKALEKKNPASQGFIGS